MKKPPMEWFKEKVTEFSALIKEDWQDRDIHTLYNGDGNYKAVYKPSYPNNSINDVEITYIFKDGTVKTCANSRSTIAALIAPAGEDLTKLPEKCSVTANFNGFEELFSHISAQANQ